ncbi:MAG: DNA-directed RNA polymerase subunit L [Candidatus Methanosuratus sp.]|nr:DNA-directed RNA polymerase subunit L [Candidatus Methanosuratincola sp.]
MELKIISEGEKRLEFEIPGEDHTLGNYLRATLLSVEGVKQAGYDIVHPLTGGIRMVVVTEEGVAPRAAVAEALSRMGKEVEEFKEKLKAGI